MKDLQDLLYEKAKAEQDNFIAELKQKPPEKIIEASYEKVMRDDILMLFENEEFEPRYVKALLKEKYPLAVCYERWLKADCSHMEMLKDSIEDCADRLIAKNAEQKKTQKHQPER